MTSIFRKAEHAIEDLFGGHKHSHTHSGHDCAGHHPESHSSNRYQSFAAQSSGGAKWFVDGASYFWAVSVAIEEAKESIYILDWWLSPELYLRRPPSINEGYRLDNMLKAAAERGVRVNVIVYKEVPQALTLNSEHTQKALEALHPNIKVFRHPEHAPSGTELAAELESSFKNLTVGGLNAFSLSKVSGDALKALYGTHDDAVLFWAHHEKLCIVDNKVGFLGGLDLCFGRWDTNSHPIADAHPGNLEAILFPGQDYNNARIYDFEGVNDPFHNKLDRTKSSRMGWSDISVSVDGPIVGNLLEHFIDRWNYIFDQKYIAKNYNHYTKLSPNGASDESSITQRATHRFGELRSRFHWGFRRMLGEEQVSTEQHEEEGHEIAMQVCRSCTAWSSGHDTEHSIANAYINTILNAQHFVYIENQFFITAVSDKQHPVTNKIGAAIVERIVRAHQAGEDFRVIVCIPAVPGFAGDLKSDGALGTRAIMEYQYNSISRGGNSIIESCEQQGVDDPKRYIRFFNLRNYDRINASSTMAQVERESGVSYETARREHDDIVGAGYYPTGEGTGVQEGRGVTQYDRFQEATTKAPDLTWDTISACYMNEGPDLSKAPWQGSPESELEAFVSEELYIHTKVLIADDKVVICGSANLNDRSQLGTHDSEIAVVIEDPTPVESKMNGQPFTASQFATSLRRQIFRKHLGLLPDQRWDHPTANWTPVDHDRQVYDFGSSADLLVEDPLSSQFWDLWTTTAKTNTDVFSKAFHPVPNDLVRSWKDYDDFFSRHFYLPDEKIKDEDKVGKVAYGHVVVEEFPGGVEELKQWLSRIRGNLVEMPLDFLVDVKDLAKEGLSLNSFTDELYT